jgi:DNA polymerase III subunit gamma/tau
MESQTLYRKYRPKNFSEVVGQKHIVQTLTNAIKNNRIGQAYLFTGPRGTGKTSIARIFAKTVNCSDLKPARDASPARNDVATSGEHSDAGGNSITCEKCPACLTIQDGRSLDIIEIDAASNTGVDNIRELKETVALPPTSLRYKVYIIDEVHMLSTGAFNALLKTLEEPPAHVIFILATTEIHKVPQTILSRCQRFDFTRLPLQNIIEKLTLIAKNEKVKIDRESLEMIAIAAEGGMRDAESLLNQVISLEDKDITIKEVEEILGTTDRKFAGEVAEMLIANDSTGAIRKVNELLNDGYDLQIFNKSLINYLRQLMLLKISVDLKSSFAYEMTNEQVENMLAQTKKTDLQKIVIAINLFLDAQNKISAFLLPQMPLEIAIIKATHTFPAEIPQHMVSQKPLTQEPQHVVYKPQSAEKSLPATLSKEIATPAKNEPEQKNSKSVLTYDIQSNWNKILEAIKPMNHSLQALLYSCQVISVENNKITLATPYDFYKEKLNDPSNRSIVESVFYKVLGSSVTLKTVTDKEAGIKRAPAKSDPEAPAGEQNSLLASAMEIMGGKIVEE